MIFLDKNERIRIIETKPTKEEFNLSLFEKLYYSKNFIKTCKEDTNMYWYYTGTIECLKDILITLKLMSEYEIWELKRRVNNG